MIIIRRLLQIYPEKKDRLKGPITVVLTNISLFSENNDELKEAATFLY
jgi:hypothetical protein